MRFSLKNMILRLLTGLLAFTAATAVAEVRNPAKVDEPIVRVYGARTMGAKGIFGVHTWIAVKPEGTSDFTAYEIIGWRLRWSESALVIRNRARERSSASARELYAETHGPR